MLIQICFYILFMATAYNINQAIILYGIFIKFSEKFVTDTDKKTSDMRPLWEKGEKHAK